MRAIIAGPDRGLGDALREQGVDVTRIEGIVTKDDLVEAGVGDADLFVLTDVDEATAVPVALDVNPDLRAVIYAPENMPEFVSAQVDISISPDVLPVDAVAEELAREQ